MISKKANFLIIGSAKCGTTTLAGILDSHPDCCFSRPKELYFFQEKAWDITAMALKDGKPNPNYLQGLSWYQSAWSHYQGESAVGEGTPAYSCRTYCPQTASNIHAFNPQMKIIYMVRDPLARMISHWRMTDRNSYEPLDRPIDPVSQAAREGFEMYLNLPEAYAIRIWDEARYNYQLEAYLKLFPREHVLVSFLEDWSVDQKAEVSRILEFLDLDPKRVDISKSMSLNRAVDSKRSTLLRRITVRPSLRPVLRAIAGQKLWGGLSKKYAWTSVPLRSPKSNFQSVNRFLDYVEKDNRIFLKEWGKTADFWNPTRLTSLD